MVWHLVVIKNSENVTAWQKMHSEMFVNVFGSNGDKSKVKRDMYLAQRTEDEFVCLE